jgi:hypothetical protein
MLGLLPETELPDGLFYAVRHTIACILSRDSGSRADAQMTWGNDIDADVSAFKAPEASLKSTIHQSAKLSVALMEQSKCAWCKG